MTEPTESGDGKPAGTSLRAILFVRFIDISRRGQAIRKAVSLRFRVQRESETRGVVFVLFAQFAPSSSVCASRSSAQI